MGFWHANYPPIYKIPLCIIMPLHKLYKSIKNAFEKYNLWVLFSEFFGVVADKTASSESLKRHKNGAFQIWHAQTEKQT